MDSWMDSALRHGAPATKIEGPGTAWAFVLSETESSAQSTIHEDFNARRRLMKLRQRNIQRIKNLRHQKLIVHLISLKCANFSSDTDRRGQFACVGPRPTKPHPT